MKKGFLTLTLIALSFCSVIAQRGWEVGGMLGASHYFGDLNTNYSLSFPGVAGSLVARFNFDERVCLKFSGNFANVSADDSYSSNSYEKARNLSFESAIISGTVQGEFNFLPYVHGSRDKFYSPYILAGFSVVNFNPQAEYNGTVYDLRTLGTEGQFRGEEYYSTTGAFVFGGGLKLDLSYAWSINIEISTNRMFNDYLDDVSTVYADREDIEDLRGEVAAILSDRSIPIVGINEGTIGEPGRQRGDSKGNDSFLLFEVGMVYYFGDLRCPKYSQ